MRKTITTSALASARIRLFNSAALLVVCIFRQLELFLVYLKTDDISGSPGNGLPYTKGLYGISVYGYKKKDPSFGKVTRNKLK